MKPKTVTQAVEDVSEIYYLLHGTLGLTGDLHSFEDLLEARLSWQAQSEILAKILQDWGQDVVSTRLVPPAKSQDRALLTHVEPTK